MKKFCHPLLLKNQERVWLDDKKAVSHPPSSPTPFTHMPHATSLRRRRKSTNFVKKRKRMSFNVCKRNRQARNEQKS